MSRGAFFGVRSIRYVWKHECERKRELKKNATHLYFGIHFLNHFHLLLAEVGVLCFGRHGGPHHAGPATHVCTRRKRGKTGSGAVSFLSPSRTVQSRRTGVHVRCFGLSVIHACELLTTKRARKLARKECRAGSFVNPSAQDAFTPESVYCTGRWVQGEGFTRVDGARAGMKSLPVAYVHECVDCCV